MAFASTITDKTVFGDKRVHYGTYTSDGGSTGGDLNTGLTSCQHLEMTPKASAVIASAGVVNEDLPVDGSAVTIVTVANEVGFWRAEGY